MIDFRLRNERIAASAEDPATAVILLDVVLGYGSHADPAGALAPVLETSRARATNAGRELIVIGSVCGTTDDPQGLQIRRRRPGRRRHAAGAQQCRRAPALTIVVARAVRRAQPS